MPALDQWLARYAGQNRRSDTAATWVIADEEQQVVGYVSLSMTAIDASAAPVALRRSAPTVIPALLVGRLAVDRRTQGMGVGTALVAHVLSTSVELQHKAAFRAILVDAIDDAALRWWQRFGFVPLGSGDDYRLYLLSKDVVATLAVLQSGGTGT